MSTRRAGPSQEGPPGAREARPKRSNANRVTKKKDPGTRAWVPFFVLWLPDRDSNPDKQIQSLRYYHYTIRQVGVFTIVTPP